MKMNDTGAELDRTLEALRTSFDQSFAESPMAQAQSQSFLLIRIANQQLAIRLTELSSLQIQRKIAPLPSNIPEFLGIVGIRGQLVPVFSLTSLLGYAGERAENRWILICRGEEPTALAFDQFDGYLEASLDSIYSSQGDSKNQFKHIREIVRLPSGSIPVITISSVLNVVRTRGGTNGSARGAS